MDNTQKKINFNDSGFLARLKSRDHEAVSALVHAYTEQLYRASLGLGFTQDAGSELVQSVWVTFFDVLPNFQGRSHVRTFLFGILYNKASESRRDQRRFDTSDPVDEVMDRRFDSNGHWARPPIDPERFLEGAETLGLIEKCLEALPLTQRMAFALKEIEEEKSSEICKILDVSITNLGVLLYRARNRLRECIEGKVERSGA